MGVGLNLSGRLAEAADLETWFGQVWEWLSSEFPGMAMGATLGQGPADEYPKVMLRFHPAADPMKIWFPEEKVIQISADTVSAGPGYHLFLCDLLWSMSGKFGIGWDPETDDGASNPTFFSGDPEQTYYEMFSWLGSMAASASMMAGSSFYLSMSPSYQFESEAALITPMGPRDSAWLKEVSKNPGAGADVFPWLKADAGAEYLLNKAICHMWSDVHWCPPVGDGDEALQKTVLGLLAAAYKMNPALNFPWREWAELLAYFQIDDPLLAQVNTQAKTVPSAAPLIGYRRKHVRAFLDQGWSVLVPGSLSESASFDPATQHHTWQFNDNQIMIWFTTYPTYGDAEGNIMPVSEAVLELDELQASMGQLVEEDTDGKIWRRTFMSGDSSKGQPIRFSSIFLVPGRLALSHVFSEKKEDMEFARRFFKSVDNNAGSSIRYLEQPRFPRMDLVAAN